MICVCPECGKKFDSDKKHCEHCGCEIKICAECGNVVKADLQSCDFCGLEFGVAEKLNEEKERKAIEQVKKDVVAIEAYCEKVNKKIGFISVIAVVVSIILFVIAGYKIFTADVEKLFEQKISMQDYYSQVETSIVFGAVFLALNFILADMKHVFALYFVSKKIKELNFDIDTFIKTVSLDDVIFDSSKKILIMRYIKEPFYKDIEFWKLVGSVILKIVMVILFCKGAWIILEEYLVSRLLIGTQAQFKFAINESLIVGFILIFVQLFYEIFLMKQEEALTEWVKKQKKTKQ
ncbi:MAG: zinc ribbon domain-containing protein [Clostridia bacterium]|nr:zinc ribbon domain-containing protein [Clostridia bacterium]